MATFQEIQNEALDITYKEVKVHADKMMSYYREAQRQVQARIERLYKLMEDQDISPENYATFVYQSNRLKALNQEIDKIYNNYASKAGLEIERASRISLTNQYYRNQYSLSWFTPMATPSVNLNFVLIDPLAVEMSVYGTTNAWKAIRDNTRKNALRGILPQKGKPTIKQLLFDNKRMELKRIKNRITDGIISGRSFGQMEQTIRGVFNSSINNGLRVVRTETVRNTNAADYLTAQDAKKQGVEGRRMWLAVLDSRTRSQSASMDGQMEDDKGLFHYPNGAVSRYPGGSGVPQYDINERCTTTFNINGVGPKLRRGRNPVTGKNEVSKMEDFKTWAKRHGLEKNQYGEYYQNPDLIEKLREDSGEDSLFATDVDTATKLQQEIINSEVLPNEEKIDIADYAGQNYATLNKYMRDGTFRGIKPTAEQLKLFNDQIKNVSNGISVLPSYKGEVYRGTGFSNDASGIDKFNNFLSMHKEGNIVTYKSFTSSSLSKDIAFGSFTGETSVANFNFYIKSKNGKAIWEISPIKSEQEVLFDRNSNFLVKSIKEIKGKTTGKTYNVILEEI